MKTTIPQTLIAAAYAAVTLSSLTACAPSTRPGELVLPHGMSIATLVSKPVQREAQGGGTVTVEVGVIPGTLPAFDAPPGVPTVVAWFSNAGEGGKKEKRYNFKPRSEAEYELVLLNDGSGRTKWTLNEVNRRTLARTAHMSGHLWACHAYSQPEGAPRDADFKDCDRAVQYDSAMAKGADRKVIHFAALSGAGANSASQLTAAIWISCTSGCCSLGR